MKKYLSLMFIIFIYFSCSVDEETKESYSFSGKIRYNNACGNIQISELSEGTSVEIDINLVEKDGESIWMYTNGSLPLINNSNNTNITFTDPLPSNYIFELLQNTEFNGDTGMCLYRFKLFLDIADDQVIYSIDGYGGTCGGESCSIHADGDWN